MNGAGRGEMEEEEKEKVVMMWGYLPGVSPQRSPVLSPAVVPMPEAHSGDRWSNVCGGGCGFAMAVSESGKLFTWGSTDDMGQSYVAAGKHEETPEVFPLPDEVTIVKAAAGWAHCVAVTAHGEVYTWGWKECVPSGKLVGNQTMGGILEKDDREGPSINDQVSPPSYVTGTSSGMVFTYESRTGEEITKRRRLSSAKQASETSTSGDETLSAPPCLVTLNAGVQISSVAAGGRHTLALSDTGQVWGWGYGGEGQLGLGTRIRMVSSPHPVPCVESAHGNDRASSAIKGSLSSEGRASKVPGCRVKAIACGGRHSAVITDSGTILTFGWGLYGQCGQGSTDDELSPVCVSALMGVKMRGVAAGLWHTVCISEDGDAYSFGGNQFGQLGTGCDQAEILPKLLEAQCLENKNVKVVSCGARHSAVTTEDGSVFCWGWNKYGQLGLADAVDRNEPTQVPVENFHATNISCGWWHTLALGRSSA